MLNRTAFVHRVMFKEQDVIVISRLFQKLFFFLHGDQGSCVVSHHVSQWNVSHRRQEISHETNRAVFVPDHGDHHFIRMSGYVKDVKLVESRTGFCTVNQRKLPALFHWKNIFAQETGFFSWVRLCGPLPMIMIGPIPCIFESQRWLSIDISHTAATMVEMQMREKH